MTRSEDLTPAGIGELDQTLARSRAAWNGLDEAARKVIRGLAEEQVEEIKDLMGDDWQVAGDDVVILRTLEIFVARAHEADAADSFLAVKEAFLGSMVAWCVYIRVNEGEWP